MRCDAPTSSKSASPAVRTRHRSRVAYIAAPPHLHVFSLTPAILDDYKLRRTGSDGVGKVQKELCAQERAQATLPAEKIDEATLVNTRIRNCNGVEEAMLKRGKAKAKGDVAAVVQRKPTAVVVLRSGCRGRQL